MRGGYQLGHHFAVFVGEQWEMLSVSQVRQPVAVQSPLVTAHAPKRRLSEADAVDIWIARWLRIRRKDLLARYGCDPRRLYEVWEEKRFAGSRDKALDLFRERHPTLIDRVDYGPHRRIPRGVPSEVQPDLFASLDAEGLGSPTGQTRPKRAA
jgi:hypothetical protein